MSLFAKAAQGASTAALVLSTLSLHAASATAPATPPQEARWIAVYDFVVGFSEQKLGPADTVCDNAALTPQSPDFLVNDPDLPAKFTQGMVKKLASKHEVFAASDAAPLEKGTLVLPGCLTEANP